MEKLIRILKSKFLEMIEKGWEYYLKKELHLFSSGSKRNKCIF